MRPISLRPHEARQLAEAGEVLVVRPVNPQPTMPKAGWDGVYADPYNHGPEWAFWLSDNRMTEPRTWACPLGPPGTKAWGREKHAQTMCEDRGWSESSPDGAWPIYAADDAEWDVDRWRSAAAMPRWASRFPSLVVASVRLCRLSGLDDDDRKLTRACRPGDPANPKLHLVDLVEFEEDWDRDNPKHPAASDPWVWAALLRMED